VLDICNYVACWRILWHATVNMFHCMTYREQYLFHEISDARIVLYFGFEMRIICILTWKPSDDYYLEYKDMQFVFFSENVSSIYTNLFFLLLPLLSFFNTAPLYGCMLFRNLQLLMIGNVMIFIYCNWVSTRWQRSVDLYKNRTRRGQKRKIEKNTKTLNTQGR